MEGGEPEEILTTDILSQVCVELSYGHHTVHATVLVQQRAPNHLLLGTDVQSKLRFSLIVKTPEKLVDLLTGEEWCRHPRLPLADPLPSQRHSRPEDQHMNKSTEGHCSGGGMEQQAAMELEETRQPESDGADEDLLSSSELESPLPNKLSVVPSQETTVAPSTTGQPGQMMSGPCEPMGPVGVVRLLKSEQIPAGYRKMVRAREVASAMLMFTSEIRKEDVLLPDAVFEGTEGACLTLVVSNRGPTVRLERDTTLGSVVPVEEAQPHDSEVSGSEEVDGATDGRVCAHRQRDAGARDAGAGVAATAAVTVGPPDTDPESQHRRLHIEVC